MPDPGSLREKTFKRRAFRKNPEVGHCAEDGRAGKHLEQVVLLKHEIGAMKYVFRFRRAGAQMSPAELRILE